MHTPLPFRHFWKRESASLDKYEIPLKAELGAEASLQKSAESNTNAIAGTPLPVHFQINGNANFGAIHINIFYYIAKVDLDE